MHLLFLAGFVHFALYDDGIEITGFYSLLIIVYPRARRRSGLVRRDSSLQVIVMQMEK